MAIEIFLFAVSVAAMVSSTDFITKAIANFAGNLGVPEYLVSTNVVSFTATLPIFLATLYSNTFNVPTLGVSTIIGFSTATLTLVMGVFLLKNEISVEYERYRNATFMWAATLLFFIVLIDGLIDRMDALFLLSVFAFYSIYIFYRTTTSKEHVFLKTKKSNMWLFIPALLTLIFSSFATVSIISIMSLEYAMPLALLPMTLLGIALILPLFDVLRSMPRQPIFTFDNILGSVIVSLTLIPGVTALINPMPFYVEGQYGFLPLIVLTIISLSFAVTTRFKAVIHKKTGILLIASYLIFLALLLIG